MCEKARKLVVQFFDNLDRSSMIRQLPHSEIIKLSSDSDLNVAEERQVFEFVKDYLTYRSTLPEKE